MLIIFYLIQVLSVIDADNPIDSRRHQDEDDLPMPLVGCEPCEASNDTAELVTPCPHRPP